MVVKNKERSGPTIKGPNKKIKPNQQKAKPERKGKPIGGIKKQPPKQVKEKKSLFGFGGRKREEEEDYETMLGTNEEEESSIVISDGIDGEVEVNEQPAPTPPRKNIPVNAETNQRNIGRGKNTGNKNVGNKNSSMSTDSQMNIPTSLGKSKKEISQSTFNETNTDNILVSERPTKEKFSLNKYKLLTTDFIVGVDELAYTKDFKSNISSKIKRNEAVNLDDLSKMTTAESSLTEQVTTKVDISQELELNPIVPEGQHPTSANKEEEQLQLEEIPPTQETIAVAESAELGIEIVTETPTEIDSLDLPIEEVVNSSINPNEVTQTSVTDVQGIDSNSSVKNNEEEILSLEGNEETISLNIQPTEEETQLELKEATEPNKENEIDFSKIIAEELKLEEEGTFVIGKDSKEDTQIPNVSNTFDLNDVKNQSKKDTHTDKDGNDTALNPLDEFSKTVKEEENAVFSVNDFLRQGGNI